MVERKFLGMDFTCALNSVQSGEFPEKDCLLPLISKLLGYLIVAASTTVKLPQPEFYNLSGLLAGTAPNPFGNGFYQGPADAPLEAATAYPGVYAKGAYPGYPGDLLVDKTSGASYNAHGANGRKYVLPAIYDPSTSKCSTLV